MARPLTRQQRKFKAASNSCMSRGPHSWKEFGRCMKTELGGRKRRRKPSRRARKRPGDLW